MKYLTLKQKIKHLPVFSTSFINTLSNDVKTLKVQISTWKKKGLVVPLRKGLYVLEKKEREIEPPRSYLANQIFFPSYVSMESALFYYGLIPEFVAQVTSVTTRKTCRFKNEFGTFTYQHVQPKAFTGFNSIEDAGLKSLIASPEKAIIDFIYLNLSRFNEKDSKIFEESYRFQNCESLSKKKIKFYAKLFNSKKLITISNLFIKELVK